MRLAPRGNPSSHLPFGAISLQYLQAPQAFVIGETRGRLRNSLSEGRWRCSQVLWSESCARPVREGILKSIEISPGEITDWEFVSDCCREKYTDDRKESRQRSVRMSSSTVTMELNAEKVWHTGQGTLTEFGAPEQIEEMTDRKKKVILVTWDRGRGIIFMTLSVSFVVWAAIYFPLIVK